MPGKRRIAVSKPADLTRELNMLLMADPEFQVGMGFFERMPDDPQVRGDRRGATQSGLWMQAHQRAWDKARAAYGLDSKPH